MAGSVGTDEGMNRMFKDDDKGYVLDGELIVVRDDTDEPMPWCESKWRYDSGGGGCARIDFKPAKEDEV